MKDLMVVMSRPYLKQALPKAIEKLGVGSVIKLLLSNKMPTLF